MFAWRQIISSYAVIAKAVLVALIKQQQMFTF